MNALRRIAIACIIVAVSGYGVYLVLFPSVTLRYRLSLDIEVDGVVYTGSGIIEILYDPRPWIPSQTGYFPRRLRAGYAITVDLGKRGLLFVVDARPIIVNPDARKGLSTTWTLYPRGEDLSMLPLAVLRHPQVERQVEMLTVVRNLRNETGTVDVSLERLPMMLWLRDRDDRNSNEEVDPRNLAAALGPGVRFIGATLQVTNDPVTPMPPNWPKWLVNEQGQEGFLVNGYDGETHGTFWCSAQMFKGE